MFKQFLVTIFQSPVKKEGKLSNSRARIAYLRGMQKNCKKCSWKVVCRVPGFLPRSELRITVIVRARAFPCEIAACSTLSFLNPIAVKRPLSTGTIFQLVLDISTQFLVYDTRFLDA